VSAIVLPVPNSDPACQCAVRSDPADSTLVTLVRDPLCPHHSLAAAGLRPNAVGTVSVPKGRGKKRRESRSGFLGLLGKIGAKVAPFVLKLATVAKLTLFAASFTAYSLLFSWQFAAALISMIVIHEAGHLTAMKHYGMRTKGIWLIPFVGGAAVTSDEFPTRRAEALTALAGPATGLALSGLCLAGYMATGWATLAALASWNALLNVFNLLPVVPLDGGRIAKSALMSISSRVGLAVMVVTSIAGIVLGLIYGIYLAVVVLPLAAADLIYEWRGRRRNKVAANPLPRPLAFRVAGAWLALTGVLLVVMVVASRQPDAAAALHALEG
jgi:Zn-dependent protease